MLKYVKAHQNPTPKKTSSRPCCLHKTTESNYEDKPDCIVQVLKHHRNYHSYHCCPSQNVSRKLRVQWHPHLPNLSVIRSVYESKISVKHPKHSISTPTQEVSQSTYKNIRFRNDGNQKEWKKYWRISTMTA